MNEIWKDIRGFEGWYQVSSLGRVRSLDRFISHYRGGKRLYKGSLVKSQDKRGYNQVRLKKDGKSYYFQVHRLVAIEFIDDTKQNLQVNHIDGNKKNNNLDNLEWVTPSENIQHALKIGRFSDVQKLKAEDVLKIRDSKKPLRSLGSEYGVSSVIIHRVKSGKSYKRIA